MKLALFRKLAAALIAGLFLFSTGAMAGGFHCPSGEHYYHSTGTCIK